MAREPYRGVELTEAYRPVASPVDTFVQAQVPSRDTSLQDLARSLSSLGGSLGELMGKRDREAEEDQRLQGEAAFHTNNAGGYAQGVAAGEIPAQASKSWMQGFKQAQGTAAGNDMEQRFAAAYDTWEGKNSADPKAYDGFVAKFMKENIGTNDPDVLRGLLPKVRQITANYQQKHIGDVSAALMKDAIRTEGAINDQAIENAVTAGLANKKGTDYGAIAATIETNRAAALKRGITEDAYDRSLVDGVTAQAIKQNDPKLLGFLDRKVPGKDYTWANTPYGRDERAKAQETIDVAGRKAVAEAEKNRREVKQAEKDSVTRDTINRILKDPNAPLPEDLLARGEKVDPDFRVNAITWRDKIGKGTTTSDNAEVLRVTREILDGGGTQAVQKAMRDGVFKNPEDLRTAWRFAEGMQKEGPKIDGILKGQSVKTLFDTIKVRTANDKDVSKVFDDGSVSNEGLQAQYDFRTQLLQWAIDNPNANVLQQEKAVADIGAGILKRLEQPGGDLTGMTLNRQGLPEPNKFGAATSPVSGAAPAPAAPQGAPAATQTVPNPLAPPASPQAAPPPAAPQAHGFVPGLPGAATPATPGDVARDGYGMPRLDAAPPAAPASPPAAAPAPAQPAPPLPPPRPPEATPAPANATEWLGTLPEATRQALQGIATKKGQTLEQTAAEAYQKGVTSGRIPAPQTPGKQSAVAPDGTPIDTASMVEGAMNRAIGNTFAQPTPPGQVPTNAPRIPGGAPPTPIPFKVQTEAGAVPIRNNMAAAVINDGPRGDINHGVISLRGPNGELLGQYRFVNGGGGAGTIPHGSYTVSNFRDAATRQGQGLSDLGDTFDLNDVFDSKAGRTRTALRIHEAHGNGTLGCIGIQGGSQAWGDFTGKMRSLVEQGGGKYTLVLGNDGDPGSSPGGNMEAAFARALKSTEPTQGNYALAVIKDNPKAAHILDFVAGPESRGNYNAIFGNAGSTEDLSKRTLDETIAWSGNRGTASSATGRYQFMAATMRDLKKTMKLSGSEPFTPELQDRMAMALLERRGFSKWQAGKISDEKFANNLALEWASLPNVTAQNGRQAGQSAYAGDGLNKSLVSTDQVMAAIRGSGALPGAQLAKVAQQAVQKPGIVQRIKSMFTPAPADPYSKFEPDAGVQRMRATNPNPVANSEKILSEAPPELSAAVRKAQADNPKVRMVAGAARGGGVEVWPVDAQGRIDFSPGAIDAVGAALAKAGAQLGTGVNFAKDTRTLSTTKKTLKA